MKKIKILLLLSFVFLLSCSTDNQNNDINIPKYAMTAKINGANFEGNNPFGTNMYSSTNIWDYFPLQDFVLLQGENGGMIGTQEINIWLKKSDIAIGTYAIGKETFNTPPTHFIDFIDLSSPEQQFTKNGSITITAVNTSTKIVTGTFTLNVVADLSNPNLPISFVINNGTFKYQYAN